MSNFKRINIQLSPETYEQLKKKAHRQDVSIAKLVRLAVEIYLAKHITKGASL